ncbi:hypothetical protein vseg_014467 [Gypsophila vaccaria]
MSSGESGGVGGGVGGGAGGGVLDCGAGSIVWVRRRNGSWWPGRILGPHDLSASHLMSPRSGTPVKLLGREDASVDWYNLEKSKRVKSFRCGEFDDCILRAEASQGLPSKKREKYARREDAILHALHLEKQFLLSKLPAPTPPTPTPAPPAPAPAPPAPSAPPPLSSFQNGLPHRPPEDHSILVPAVSPNHSCFDTSADSDSRNSFPNPNKRLLDAPADDDSIPKRHRPLRPLVSNVRHLSHLFADKPPSSESSHLLGLNLKQGFSQHPAFALQESEDTVSGSSEQTESDSSETHSIEPQLDAAMLLSDAETCMRAQPRLSVKLTGAESTSNGESDEPSHDDRSQFRHLEQMASSAEVSKWQQKGKRNVRSTGKRPIERLTNKTSFEARGTSLNKLEASHSLSYYHNNGFADDDVCSEDDFELHAHGHGQRGYLPSQDVARRHSYIGLNRINWELASGRPFNEYWEERGDCFSPIFNGHDMLIDAELKVQANLQGEHVPWVSLMSKLNGKAIIGHPVQIESLEDGSTDMILSTSNEPRFETNKGKVPPPMWRTARRTANVRVPHPHQASQLYVDGDTEYQHLPHSGKSGAKKSATPNSVRKGSKLKKNDSRVCRSSQGSNKASRKGNVASNQKTKPLSSIGFDQKVTNKTSGDDTGHYMDGAIKSVGSGPPTVACIPVKLAFSRLLKAVGRPPSGSPAKHCVSVGSNKDSKPASGTL